MNRIQPRQPPSTPAAAGKKSSPSTESPVIAGGILVRAEAGKFPFALFAPLNYERNYAYPLIVWLHGPDDNENQLRRIMPLVSLRNYAAIAPRGTAGGETEAAAFGWLQSEEH